MQEEGLGHDEDEVDPISLQVLSLLVLVSIFVTVAEGLPSKIRKLGIDERELINAKCATCCSLMCLIPQLQNVLLLPLAAQVVESPILPLGKLFIFVLVTPVWCALLPGLLLVVVHVLLKVEERFLLSLLVVHLLVEHFELR